MAGEDVKGIRGWLLVYILGSIPVLTVYSMGLSGWFFEYPFSLMLTIFLLAAIPLLLILVKSPKAPRWNVAMLWILAVLMTARAISVILFPGGGQPSMTGEELRGVVPILSVIVTFSLGWTIIWSRYFKKSVRVRNTFGKSFGRAEKFWNIFAKRYSKSPVKDMKGYEKTLAATRKFLKKKAVVLEVGCGTGTTALKLANSVSKMTATDISSNMIKIAKEKVEKQKIRNVNFVQSTLFDEKLKKHSFDVIIAFNLIHLLEDPQKAIKKISQLLKPNGLFISKTPCLRESKLMPVLSFFISKVIGPVKCFTIKEFKAYMTNEGFEIIDEHIYPEKPPRIFAVARKGSE